MTDTTHRILTLRRDGHTMREIARTLGCSKTRVQTTVTRHMPTLTRKPEKLGSWEQRRKAEVARLGVPVEVPARPTGSRLREKRWTMLYGAPHATERDDSHA